MNFFRTAMLLAALTALFMGVGFLIGRHQGMVIVLIIAAAMNLLAYWRSDKLVLSMYHARKVDALSAPELYELVRQLATAAKLPMRLPNRQPAAERLCHPQSRTCCCGGYDGPPTKAEHGGKNRDTLIMTITATIAGAISMLANLSFYFGGDRDDNGHIGLIGMILLVILALAAALVQMTISRTREYAADRGGAAIVGRPLWLASALRKIADASERIPNYDAERNPATAHLFIINPLSGKRMDNLFSTHPHVENRIAQLNEMRSKWRGLAGCDAH
jgi:heat shock protein HtpX